MKIRKLWWSRFRSLDESSKGRKLTEGKQSLTLIKSTVKKRSKGFHFHIKIIISITLLNSGFLNSRIGDKFKKRKNQNQYKYENSKITVISVSIVGRIVKGEEIDGRETSKPLHFFHQTSSSLTFSSQHEETFNPSLSVWTGDETRRVSRTRTLDTDTGNEMEI